jgi:hypothetical protein
VSGEERTQPITRGGVVWTATTLDDKTTTLVQFSNPATNPGLALSTRAEAGAVRIKASRGSGDTAKVKETALCVALPDAEETECPPEGEQ